jgi:hypothetical protein
MNNLGVWLEVGTNKQVSGIETILQYEVIN